jgi:hypothetical protein
MTTDEALAFLEKEYVERSEFMARLRHEGTLDRAAINDTLAAIDALRIAWGNATCLSVEHIWLLSHTDEALTPYCDMRPEHGVEIFNAQCEILEQVEKAITSAGGRNWMARSRLRSPMLIIGINGGSRPLYQIGRLR